MEGQWLLARAESAEAFKENGDLIISVDAIDTPACYGSFEIVTLPYDVVPPIFEFRKELRSQYHEYCSQFSPPTHFKVVMKFPGLGNYPKITFSHGGGVIELQVHAASSVVVNAIKQGVIPIGRPRQSIPIGWIESGIPVGKDGPFPMKTSEKSPVKKAPLGSIVALDGGTDSVLVESSSFSLEEIAIRAKNHFEENVPGADVMYEMRVDDLKVVMGGLANLHKLTARVTLVPSGAAAAYPRAS